MPTGVGKAGEASGSLPPPGPLAGSQCLLNRPVWRLFPLRHLIAASGVLPYGGEGSALTCFSGTPLLFPELASVNPTAWLLQGPSPPQLCVVDLTAFAPACLPP